MDLLRLMDYQAWADEKLFSFLHDISEKEINKVFGGYTSIKNRMAHIVLALRVWFDRIEGHSPYKLPDYSEMNSEEIISEWRELNTKLAVYFSERRQAILTYTTTKGHRFEAEHEDLAVHLLNHTTFYRGQIIMMIRMLGYPVENTDYIYFSRS